MASRLLRQLDARIAAARDPVEAAGLRAQRGIYLARQGNHAEAQAIVDAIRSEFAERPNAVVTAWVSLLEAVIHFFSQPGPKALDRLRRAHALGRAIQHPELVPLCAAWLAHIEFNANRMEAMLQYATEALRLAQPDHHAAQARVSLVIADAFHFAGRFDLAKPWYAAVREHALAEGDDAMISAMLHNVAALRANQVRLADAFGEPHPDETERALLELESTRNYDLGIGAVSLGLLVPLVRAQLCMVQRHYSDAIPLYSQTLDKRNEENLERREGCFYAERAWCYQQIGNESSAAADVEAAIRRLSINADADDEAAMHARLSSIYFLRALPEDATKHAKLALSARQRHKEAQCLLLEALVNASLGSIRAQV
jgi:tetratricopeptide (TPR) repeat protein